MRRHLEGPNPLRSRQVFLHRPEGLGRPTTMGDRGLPPHPPAQLRAAFVLQAIQYTCLVLALVCLGYVVFSYSQAGVFQTYQSWKFDRELAQRSLSRAGIPAVAGHASPDYPRTSGSVLGRMEIPRIGLSAMVLEGDDESVLRKGPGHLPGTPFPGRPGNVVIAAHRDTFFRPLHAIQKGDEITVTTSQGVYKYRVDWINEVSPQDVKVLKARRHPTLTLITCYPFYFVGDAPQRFVVQAAELPSSQSPAQTSAARAQPAAH